MQRKDITGILEFIGVVESGSFSAAAEQLNTSRARISQLVAALESHLGVQLLHRSTRSLALTDSGEQFYQTVKRGFTLVDQAIIESQASQHTLSGAIRINSVGGEFGEQILAPKLMAFMALYPDINIHLDFSSSQIELPSEQYDFAIRMGELQDSSLIARNLCRYPPYLVASADYAKLHGVLSHPKELSAHKTIYGSLNRWHFEHSHTGQICDVNVSGHFHCANGHVMKKAAMAGLGVTRLPSYYVEKELKEGSLINMLAAWQTPHSPVSAVYPQARYRVRRVQVLIDYLVTAFEQNPH